MSLIIAMCETAYLKQIVLIPCLQVPWGQFNAKMVSCQRRNSHNKSCETISSYSYTGQTTSWIESTQWLLASLCNTMHNIWYINFQIYTVRFSSVWPIYYCINLYHYQWWSRNTSYYILFNIRSMASHYSGIIMSVMAFPITSILIVYSTVIQVQIKENIKAPRHWPLWGEFTGDQWIPRTKGQ